MTYTNIRPINRPIYYAHSEYTSAMQDACDNSTSADARPHCRLMPQPLRISAQTLYGQKLDSCWRLRHHSVGLSLLVFMQLFSKFARSDARQTGAKTEFDAKYPIKVIEGRAFCDHWTTRDSESLYRLIMLALFLKFPKKYPAKTLKIAVVHNPSIVSCPCPWNPANVRINLILT